MIVILVIKWGLGCVLFAHLENVHKPIISNMSDQSTRMTNNMEKPNGCYDTCMMISIFHMSIAILGLYSVIPMISFYTGLDLYFFGH